MWRMFVLQSCKALRNTCNMLSNIEKRVHLSSNYRCWNQYPQYPPGNFKIFPFFFGTFESMMFLFSRWDMGYSFDSGSITLNINNCLERLEANWAQYWIASSSWMTGSSRYVSWMHHFVPPKKQNNPCHGTAKMRSKKVKTDAYPFCGILYHSQYLIFQWKRSLCCIWNMDCSHNLVVVSHIFYFHPENWGWFPIWQIYFQWVGSTTN